MQFSVGVISFGPWRFRLCSGLVMFWRFAGFCCISRRTHWFTIVPSIWQAGPSRMSHLDAGVLTAYSISISLMNWHVVRCEHRWMQHGRSIVAQVARDAFLLSHEWVTGLQRREGAAFLTLYADIVRFLDRRPTHDIRLNLALSGPRCVLS